MSQPELLKRVVTVLEGAGIDYMVTGSIASSLQGEPRASHDIDVVVSVGESAVDVLLEAFPPPDFYLSADAIRDAIRDRSMFNLLHLSEGEKVDFWLFTDSPFDRSRFARKYQETAFGIALRVSRPEDTILAKLHWCRLAGGSEKQLTDALRVYEVQGAALDLTYLEGWAHELGLEPLWNELKAKARSA